MPPSSEQSARARQQAIERGDHRSLRAMYVQDPTAAPDYLRADPAAVWVAVASWVFWVFVFIRAL